MRKLLGGVVALSLMAAGASGALAQSTPRDKRKEAGRTEAKDPNQLYDPALYQGLEFRNIGPYRGGRVTAVAGVVQDPLTFYMGSTGGGVWKTTDGGLTWRNVTDGQLGSGSIGAVAVAPSDPNVIYAGTGSACIRGNVSPGDGIYKSTDAGKTWVHVGLEDAGQIGRIAVHPEDPDLAYVAVLGHAFGPNEQRGVFRSRDGGKTWERVLFVSDRAGAVDLALDPTNPRILYAAVWEAVRKPWMFVSGGEGSGLYRSRDGGDTWEKLERGFPSGLKGRIGVAVSPARPGRVWAIVEAEDGGVFRSDDGGDSFRRVNAERKLRQRAWYYTHIYADPRDEDTVYVLNVGLYRSTDGGKSFEFIRAPHGDHHDLWIHPEDPRILINGNDGGANVSYNGGATWSTQANQPTGEFYRVTVDDQFPYRVYGAQQDNSTVSIPSRTSGSGITRADWYPVGGGESGHIAVDPRDPSIVYAGSYGGTITRYDHRTREVRHILAYPQLALGQAPRDLKYRFQWNAPIRISPHDPSTLYHCSNYVHRSRDGGQSWETISPDLTRNDPEKQDYSGGPITRDNTGVEVYGTIFAFEESPHTPGLLWVGTDDGRVHLSRDAGAHWEEITPGKMPEWGQVNMIELSAHGPGRALLAVTRYKLDDFKPYIFRTDDYGRSWTLLTDGKNGIPADHFVRVVREDPVRRGLLYAGTEFGLYVSFDDGRHWQTLQLNLPVTPVTDMVVKDDDLVVATQGRAFWILDDLTPLRQLGPEAREAPAYLFAPAKTYRTRGGDGEPAAESAGKNPPEGALIFYTLAEAPAEGEELVLEILDDRGNLVRRFSSLEEERRAPDPYAEFRVEPPEPRLLPAKAGVNRFVWDLRYPDLEITKGTVLWGSPRGPRVVPGTYRVRLVRGDWSQERPLEVLQDPRVQATVEELREQFELAREIAETIHEVHRTIRTIRGVREQIEELLGRAEQGAPEAFAALRAQGESILNAVREIENRLTQPRSESAQDPLNFPPQLDNDLLYLYGVVLSADARPTAGARQRWADLREEASAWLGRASRVFTQDLAAFNENVRSRGIPPIVPVEARAD